MRSKKGIAPVPPEVNVAALIGLIALFIVLYLILLPACDRCVLLATECPKQCEDIIERETVLSESPGLVYPFKEKTLVHEIAPVDLYVKFEPQILELRDFLSVKRSLFTNKYQVLSFDLRNLEDLQDVNLYFSVREAKGNLLVYINDEELLNEEVNKGELKVIKVPKEYIAEENNLKVYTSLNVLGANRYILENLRVGAQYSYKNTREEREVTISSTEYKSIDSAILEYTIYCNSLAEETTNLRVSMNRRPLESKIITCRTRRIINDLSIYDIEQGKNTITFEIDKGDYSLEDMELKIELTEKLYSSYEFTITEDQFEDIKSKKTEALLYLEFEDNKIKDADININDETLELYTRGSTFSDDISDYLEEGINIIEIIPNKEFEMDKLEIKLE